MNAAPFPHGSGFETSPVRSFGEVSIALLKELSARFEPVGEDGTALAINYSNLGVAAESALRSRRGGAHNSAARQSNALTTGQIANLKAAERFSRQIGLQFTRMITIHWEAAGVPLDGMARATGHFLDLLSKALKRHGSETAYVWVHEGGEGKGGHCHLLVHIPAELSPLVAKLQRGWLRRVTGKPYKEGVIHGKPIGGRLGDEVANPPHHAANLHTVLEYLLKGANGKAAECFDLARLEPGGLVIGKRCGTSQNIGAAARKKANFMAQELSPFSNRDHSARARA